MPSKIGAGGRLQEIGVPEAFERAVRALVAVGDYFVVVSRESARPDPAEFERRVASPLRGLIERAQSLGEVRDDLNRQGNGLARASMRQSYIGGEHTMRQAGQCLFGGVRMNRAHAAEMTGIERLKQVECFGSSYLSNEDPVGPVAK